MFNAHDNNDFSAILDGLNHLKVAVRLKNAAEAQKLIHAGKIIFPDTVEVNNHVHTKFSFSPYYPAAAAYQARKAGLRALGIMDHDSIGGCREMVRSASLLGIACTCGFELRVNFTGTALEGKKINSPDSENIGYVVIHGIPRNRIKDAEKFLAPLQKARNIRNRAMVDSLNELLQPLGHPPLSFEQDVAPLSEFRNRGTVTERHILEALALRMINTVGKGRGMVDMLENNGEANISPKLKGYLSDPQNPHYLYDLIGVLKTNLMGKFFIQPDNRECIPVLKAVEFADSINAIPVYSYLGDVGESPTGDKKAEKFEDDYLDLLVAEIKKLGFKGLAYMPPRNSLAQIKRIQDLAAGYNLMEISGVDINSSRQTFNCPLLRDSGFKHLLAATWALIAHEKMATLDSEFALFHPRNPLRGISLKERILLYSEAGMKIDPFRPYDIKWIMKGVRKT